MKASKNSCYVVVALCLLLSCQNSVHASSKAGFPPPPPNGVFDPEGILHQVQYQTLVDRLQNLDISLKRGGGDSQPTLVPIQIVVVLVDRMGKTTNSDRAEMGQEEYAHHLRTRDEKFEAEFLAEQMARLLHDAWGVGQVTEWGGTGILIFVSMYDRVVYISRGSALDRILTRRRLASILYQSRSTMRQAKFAEAFLDIITDIGHYVELGEPTGEEKVWDILETLSFLMWLCKLVLFVTYALRGLHRMEQQAYEKAQASSQLLEIERAQALQGQYEITSCPICLECFASSTIGSDHQPLKLLRCGHVFDESCWSEWVSTGQGNVTKCPICKMDIGRPLVAPDNHDRSQLARENDDDDEQMLILRRFQQERNFRLIRLGMRYPNLVSQSQIQRWSSPTHNGPLARDPSFQLRAPQQCRNDGMRSSSTTGGGSFRSMIFGGGMSSGGLAGSF